MQPRETLNRLRSRSSISPGGQDFIGNRIQPIQSFQNTCRRKYSELTRDTLGYHWDISSYSLAMAFGTNAVISQNGWYVYQDDLAFWPPYDLVPYVRSETLDQYPKIEDIINKLVATFPGGGQEATPALIAEGQKVWQELNAMVSVEMEPDEVAKQYLLDHDLISE